MERTKNLNDRKRTVRQLVGERQFEGRDEEREYERNSLREELKVDNMVEELTAHRNRLLQHTDRMGGGSMWCHVFSSDRISFLSYVVVRQNREYLLFCDFSFIAGEEELKCHRVVKLSH
jgi:hypothetical protein